MKIYIILPTFIVVVLLQACANIHGSINAEKWDDTSLQSTTNTKPSTGIVISGGLNISLQSEYFRTIDFTFENTTGHWLRITNITLDFKNEKLDKSINFPIGQDIADWLTATSLANGIANYNTALLLNGLVLAGSIASMQADSGTQHAGNILLSSGLTAMTADSINENLNEVQNTKLLPTNHLLSGAFTIPPGLFVKKWILLHSSSPRNNAVSEVYLHYQLEDGRKETVKLPIQFFKGTH